MLPERRLQPVEEEVGAAPAASSSGKAPSERLRRGARTIGRVVWQAALRWRADRCTQEAAALAFKTALALVPLCAVCFVLLKAAGKLDERGALFEFFAGNLFPGAGAGDVQQAVLHFADNIETGAMGPLGLTVLIVLVFLLFRDIERFFTRVWTPFARAPRERSVIRTFAIFYLLATLVPFLMAVSLYHTARYWRGGVVGYLAPLGSTFLALFAANKLLPSARVRFRYAALGAGVSAMLYEAAKMVFARYVMIVLSKYHSIYGAFGLVPLVLVWIYVGWMMVLLGAEMAHAAQRLEVLEAHEGAVKGEGGWELVTGATAARVLLEVARHWSRGGKALPVEDAADRLRLPDEVVERVLRRLLERDLVLEIDDRGFLPARPPSAITLGEVLSAFRSRGRPASENDRLGRLLTSIDPARSDAARAPLSEFID